MPKQTRIILSKGLSEEPPKPVPSPWLALLQLLATIAVLTGIIYGFFFFVNRSSPDQITVPKVEKLDKQAAEILLRKSGLALGDSLVRPSEDIPEGKIIGSNPPSGQSVKQGRSITLIVSGGSNWTAVPDIREMTKRRATTILQQNSLYLGETRYAHSSLPTGFIVEQIPAPGVRVPLNTEVQVVISSGAYIPPPPLPQTDPAATLQEGTNSENITLNKPAENNSGD